MTMSHGVIVLRDSKKETDLMCKTTLHLPLNALNEFLRGATLVLNKKHFRGCGRIFE